MPPLYGLMWGWDEGKTSPAAILTVHPKLNYADYVDGKNGGFCNKERGSAEMVGMQKAAFDSVYSVLEKPGEKAEKKTA